MVLNYELICIYSASNVFIYNTFSASNMNMLTPAIIYTSLEWFYHPMHTPNTSHLQYMIMFRGLCDSGVKKLRFGCWTHWISVFTAVWCRVDASYCYVNNKWQQLIQQTPVTFIDDKVLDRSNKSDYNSCIPEHHTEILATLTSWNKMHMYIDGLQNCFKS